MYDKKSLTKIFIEKYKYASKKEKMIILNEFIEYTDYNRNYAARILERSDMSISVNTKIKNTFKKINPIELKRKINKCQSQLIETAVPVRMPLEPIKIRCKKEIKHTIPLWHRGELIKKPNPFLERQRVEEMRRAAEKAWKHHKTTE